MKIAKKIALLVLCLVAFTMFTYYSSYSIGTSPKYLAKNFDPTGEYSFNYPAEINTKFIKSYKWPPKLVVIPGDSKCTAGESGEKHHKKIESRNIGGYDFCVTTVSKVKDNRQVHLYAYSLTQNNFTYILYFGTSSDICDDFTTGKRILCELEKKGENPDKMVIGIFQSIKRTQV
jgi:hypothetical protein